MNQKFENSLTILVVGSMHPDFTIHPIYEKLFRKLHENGIRVGLLKEEIPPEDSLLKTQQLTAALLQQSRFLSKQLVGLNDIYEHDIHGRHISGSNFQKVMDLLDVLDVAEFRQPGVIEHMALEICRENAYEKELNLFRMMSQLDLYFSGIEMPKEEYAPRVLAAAASPEAARDNEPLRIQSMVKNVFKSITDNFLSGGVVFISTGGSHAHRLGANIVHHLTSHPIPLKVNVQVFRYYSQYSESFKQLVTEAGLLTNLGSVDSIAIKNIYQSLPCQIISGSWNGICFTASELEQVVDREIINCARPIAAAATTTLFAPLSMEDELLRQVRAYTLAHPEIKVDLIKTITEKNYSLALRQFCAVGATKIVRWLINRSDNFPIDFNALSSNGNNAMKWFELSKASSQDKRDIQILLEEKMQKDTTLTKPLRFE